ncbi:PrgI family protein [Olsenella sp. AM30-3LB]|uniref:PrgI family protein n=1 Tax=Olsenella sp. AM30-3LB TaxID=2292359 RepID=UPI000E5118F8|nr:PrgI family protein [Olsenella sp. AM30-3LB]RHD74838.1 PrgI family protein [Olsenella sp. AM30-3LB]
MPLSVAVHKDIGEYQEKVVGKLSLRTLLCVAGGLATSVATAVGCQLLLGVEATDASLPVMCASLPFWLLGFWRPHGMRAERFMPLLWEHVAGDGRLLYRGPEAHRMEDPPLARRTTRRHRRATRRKGAELREPSKEGR